MRTMIFILVTLASFGVSAEVFTPTDAQLYAFRIVHHANYLKETGAQYGGTNTFYHSRQIVTEGDVAVVTPALDQVYSMAVLDVSHGPVVVELPEVKGADNKRYRSIHITDQEHYTIYDEVRPVGKYLFVKTGEKVDRASDVTVIESPSDYPHIIIRIQTYGVEDTKNIHYIQDQLKITGEVGSIEFKNPIAWTAATHKIYDQNKAHFAEISKTGYTAQDHKAVFQYILKVSAGDKYVNSNVGSFGPIDSTEERSNNLEIRAGGILGHLGLPATHTVYSILSISCTTGKLLNGDTPEVFTLSAYPDVKEFWSVTRYSAITRNTIPGKQDIYNAYNTKPDANGNVTITFSVKDLKDGTYWMPVNAGEPYYIVDRYYQPNDYNNIDLIANYCKKK